MKKRIEDSAMIRIKYSIIFAFSIALIIFSGCSSLSKIDVNKEQLLLNHLLGWQNFELDGIAEFSYGQLRMRKNIAVRMNEEYFNLTVFDRGIFGMSPKPFISVRIDSAFTLDYSDAIAGMIDEIDKMPDVDIRQLQESITHIEKNRASAVRNGTIRFEHSEVIFNDLMQIERIVMAGIPSIIKGDNKDVMLIVFEYGRDGTVSNIDLLQNEVRLMKITADRVRS